jgi:hypothetical protein
VAASAFGATLDEQWADLPPLEEIIKILKIWGIYEENLSKIKL